MGTIYILQSLINNRYYIGSTKNLSKRMEEHNSGRSKYTSLTLPFKLVFSKTFPTLAEARRAEHRTISKGIVLG